MKICSHYIYDNKEKMYVSLVKRVTKHVYECKQCKVKLHDVDSQNLNNYLRYLNRDKSKSTYLDQMGDIYEMLRPIDRQY